MILDPRILKKNKRPKTKEALFETFCCSGLGHKVKEGGRHINLVALRKKAISRYLTIHTLWPDGKQRPPKAAAVMCDECIRKKVKIKFAVAKDSDEGSVYTVPIADLEDWNY